MPALNVGPRDLGIACLAVALLGGCGGGGGGGGGTTAPNTMPAPPAGPGLVDPAMVGTWTGRLAGAGQSPMTMSLSADGSMWNEGEGVYCRFNGRWGVAGGEFSASGPDCGGTIVTLRAAASTTHMSGLWGATSGRSGTFECDKQ